MIKKEDFNKLSQLDRIEFRQRYYFLDKKFEGSFTWGMVTMTLFILGFVMLSFFGLANLVGIEGALPLLRVLNKVIFIGYSLIIFGIVVDLVRFVLYLKHKKELESEYFKIEVKKKK